MAEVPAIRTVFFDAGGTLIHTAEPVGHYYGLVAGHYGLKADAGVLQQGFRAAWQELKPRDPVQGARIMDDKNWWKELVRRSWSVPGLPEDFPFEPYFEEVYELFAQPQVWRVYPDALLALDGLQAAGVACGILSNWDRRLRRILDGLELSRYFSYWVISAEVGVEKPHRDIFKKAEELAGGRGGELLLLGDDERFDGEGGRGAGWRVEIVQRPGRDLLDALAPYKIRSP